MAASSKPLLSRLVVVVALGALTSCGGGSATLSTSAVEKQIQTEFAGGGTVLVHCPKAIPQKAGKIVDCPVKVGAAAPVLVRVTQDDGEGHITAEATRQPALGDSVICGALADRLTREANQFQTMEADALSKSHPDVTLAWSRIGKSLLVGRGEAETAGCNVDALGLPPHLELFK